MTERVCQGCGGVLPDQRSNRRYCSQNCRKRRWEREEYRGTCEMCGADTSKRTHRFCAEHSDVRVAAHERRQHVVEMWAAGSTMREIADEIGFEFDHFKSEFARMRRYGYELPYRYKAYEREAA